jgi:hypothetical protein
MAHILFGCKHKKHLFLGFSRRISTDKGYLDMYHDHLIESLDEGDCLMLERPMKGNHLRPRCLKNKVIYLDALCYASEFFSRLFFLNNHSEGYDQIKTYLEERGLTAPSLRSVNREVNKFKIETWCARFFFAKIQPQSMVVTSKWLHLPFIMVANEKGIPVYEVQHGARFYYNLAYQGFGEHNHIKVDSVLTMGERWNSFPWESQSVIALGNPNFSYSQERMKCSTHPSESVLFISQPEVWKAVSFDVSQLAKKNPSVNITLRFHPKDIGSIPKRYGALEKYSNVKFEFPVHDVAVSIASHSLIVGYTSTVLFQAADMGARVALMVGEDSSHYDYSDIFGEMVGSFHRINDYDLENIEGPSFVVKEKFFSSFDADLWREMADAEQR